LAGAVYTFFHETNKTYLILFGSGGVSDISAAIDGVVGRQRGEIPVVRPFFLFLFTVSVTIGEIVFSVFLWEEKGNSVLLQLFWAKERKTILDKHPGSLAQTKKGAWFTPCVAPRFHEDDSLRGCFCSLQCGKTSFFCNTNTPLQKL